MASCTLAWTASAGAASSTGTQKLKEVVAVRRDEQAGCRCFRDVTPGGEVVRKSSPATAPPAGA